MRNKENLYLTRLPKQICKESLIQQIMKPKKVKVAVDKIHLAKIFKKSEFINNNSSVIRQKG